MGELNLHPVDRFPQHGTGPPRRQASRVKRLWLEFDEPLADSRDARGNDTLTLLGTISYDASRIRSRTASNTEG